MKVALVHDYIKEYGGAERVLEALHEIWPGAPVYTSVYLPDFLGPHKDRFAKWHIHTSIAQYLPFKEKLISPLRLLSPLLFKQFDFSEFDAVIVSSTGAYISNSINLKSQISNLKSTTQNSKSENNHTPLAICHKPVHICYCHTPPRYLYGYATAREWKNNLFLRWLGETANHFLRLVDFRAAQNVDFFIANSQEVQSRIRKFYRKDSVVIYPPVDLRGPAARQPHAYPTSLTRLGPPHGAPRARVTPQDYYLTGGRLARPKHTDLIVKVCTKLSLPLKVFGKTFAGYGDELRSLAGPTIEFVGEVNDEAKLELMQNAKAYIFASEDEDFGITPVEAMGTGTPVIAYASGGVKETITDGKTGVFFDELSIDSLIKAIQQFNNSTISSSDCIKQAQKFSKERFTKEVKLFVQKISAE